MIVRIVLALFVSGASGICYLAGLTRLMSALLLGFGSLASFFFGILFMVSAEQRQLWFPVHGQGISWPFFLISAVLAAMVILCLVKKSEPIEEESLSASHFKYFLVAFFGYLFSIFLSALLWFPSDEKRMSLDASALGINMFWGTCLYLFGTIISLYFFYRASRGTMVQFPDMMRRLVLAVFSIVHFDKMPIFIAFLLVYSPETRIIYPSIAAFALSAYIPIGVFLLKLSWQSGQSK